MLLPREIDEIFALCRQGQLDIATAMSIPNVQHLREIDGLWIFDVALEHKQRDLVTWMAKSEFKLSNSQKVSTLFAAVKSACAHMVKLAIKVINTQLRYLKISTVIEHACMHHYIDIIRIIRAQYPWNALSFDDLTSNMYTACRHGRIDVIHALSTPEDRIHLMKTRKFLNRLMKTDTKLPDRPSTFSKYDIPSFPPAPPEADLLPVWLLIAAAGCPIDYADPRVWAFTAAWGGLPLLQHITALTPTPAPAAILAGIRAASVHDRAASLALLLGVAGAGAAVAGEKEALLLAALDRGCREAAEVLVTHGDVTFNDIEHKNKRKAFFDSIHCGSVLIAEMYITHRNLDPSRKYNNCYNPISLAGTPEMVRMLLARGLRAGLPQALPQAAARLRLDTVRALLAAGATWDGSGMGRVAMAACADDGEVAIKREVMHLLIDVANKPKPDPRRKRKRNAAADAEDEEKKCDESAASDTTTGGSLHPLLNATVFEPLAETAGASLAATIEVLASRDPRLLEEPERRFAKPVVTPLMFAIDHDKVPADAVAALLAAGADVGAWGRAEQHGVFRLLLKPPFGLAPERDPRVVREKLRLLLRAGADPRGAYDGANGMTVVMGLVCPEIYNDVKTKIIVHGFTIEALGVRGRSLENELDGFDLRTTELLEDYRAREGPEHSFSDAAGSVFIADIAEGVLSGRLAAVEAHVPSLELSAPVNKKQRRK